MVICNTDSDFLHSIPSLVQQLLHASFIGAMGFEAGCMIFSGLKAGCRLLGTCFRILHHYISTSYLSSSLPNVTSWRSVKVSCGCSVPFPNWDHSDLYVYSKRGKAFGGSKHWIGFVGENMSQVQWGVDCKLKYHSLCPKTLGCSARSSSDIEVYR